MSNKIIGLIEINSFEYQNSNESEEIENAVPKIIIDNKRELMQRHIKLRKLAISNWNIFTYGLGYCLIYPILQKLSLSNSNKRLYINSNIFASVIFAYQFNKLFLKYFVRIFNYEEFDNYRIFCKKNKLEEEILF